ncbi:MAG: hypothetical protein D4R63_06090 [Methylococcaceae bacterium]|nr:MAG: hypothetical protein D4R63_06090 [Methylococcaceae bacterium]
MDYRYFHNSETETVYRIPTQPNVDEQLDQKTKKIIRWLVRMEISLTRADNIFVSGHWKYPWNEYPQEKFEAIQYTKELAISYFYERYTPKGEEINQETYQSLTTKYKIRNRANIYDRHI